MKKIAIVTTTINSPTIATLKFCDIAAKNNHIFIIVGDTKTPHEQYEELEKKYGASVVKYLRPAEQEKLFKTISDIVGWKTIERRNIGFLYAYHHTDARVVATVDDDNIPYDHWGQNVIVGETIQYDCYKNNRCDYFDPLSITDDNHLWHRGYPIEYLNMRHSNDYLGKAKKRVYVQAGLWDGDPDIDAMARLIYKPCVKYNISGFYGSEQISPFNSQNTFIDISVIPYYAMLPFIGRMDDIWGAYIFQIHFPNSVIYEGATVYQDRNVQDLVTNLEAEVIGYRHTLNLLQSGKDYYKYLPDNTLRFWDEYRNQF